MHVIPVILIALLYLHMYIRGANVGNTTYVHVNVLIKKARFYK
jgi:hypothetical protein